MSRAEIRAIHAAHDRFLESGAVSARVRDVVAESWRRSAADGVDADAPAVPTAVRADELTDFRDAHPLSQVFPLLYDVLGRAAEECDAVMAVGDAVGRLLWVSGRPSVLRQAEQIDFAEGAAWDETHAGTNAPGTALRLDAPVQILASEHFRRTVQQWSCAAAPIHDPVSRAILGVVDVTGGDATAVPQTLAMVRAAARMAEAELGRLAAVGRLWTPSPTVRAAGLGRPDCQLEFGGRSTRLSLRHSEILVILADRPSGMTGGELAVELYPGDISTSTMRAELTRLRTLLGPLLESRPYRLREDVECDWIAVSAALEAGRLADALHGYGGPLLPQSDAPGVVERRDRLERQLRSALLASRDIDLMASWTRSRWGADDLQMWECQAAALPAASPLRGLAVAEAKRLNGEFGLS
jgi:hypothetical protein